MKKIEERIEELETMVYQSKNVLTFNEASKYIGISKSYLYKLTSAGLIPHADGWGSKVLFEDVIRCQKRQSLSTGDESEENMEGEPQLRRAFHR